MNEFRKELTALLNKYNKDLETNTPDFILADFIVSVISQFGLAGRNTINWHRVKRPGPADRAKNPVRPEDCFPGEMVAEAESIEKYIGLSVTPRPEAAIKNKVAIINTYNSIPKWVYGQTQPRERAVLTEEEGKRFNVDLFRLLYEKNGYGFWIAIDLALYQS